MIQHLLAVLSVTILAGCGNSPLLNHAEGRDPDAPGFEKTGDCAVRFKISSKCLILDWKQGPSSSSESQFELKNPSAGTMLIENVSVELWMPEHGHGSSPVVIEPNDQAGYLVRDVWFIMPGLWEIRIQAVVDGVKDTAVVEVRL